MLNNKIGLWSLGTLLVIFVTVSISSYTGVAKFGKLMTIIPTNKHEKMS